MSQFSPRRRFLHEVGCGTLLATLGASLALDLQLAAPLMAEEGEESLDFCAMEPMVRMMQETPLAQLKSQLVDQWGKGVELKMLIAAGQEEARRLLAAKS